MKIKVLSDLEIFFNESLLSKYFIINKEKNYSVFSYGYLPYRRSLLLNIKYIPVLHIDFYEDKIEMIPSKNGFDISSEKKIYLRTENIEILRKYIPLDFFKELKKIKIKEKK